MPSIKRRLPALALAISALLVGGATADAQEWDVVRRSFTFINSELTIEIAADVAGELHIARGGFGRVEVAARAVSGFAGLGLGGFQSDRLVLTAVGADRVQYLVMVPQRVRVRVRVPGERHARVLASTHATARYIWESPARDDEGAALAALLAPGIDAAPGEGFVTYTDARAPLIMDVPALASVRSLTVRTGADRFRVRTDRPLSFAGGDERRIELRLSGEPMDVVVELPRGTRDFVLRLAGAHALSLDAEGRPHAYCTPLADQRLAPGREWFTFTPIDAALDCSRMEVDRRTSAAGAIALNGGGTSSREHEAG